MTEYGARDHWDAMPTGSRIIDREGRHGVVARRTGGACLWVNFDGETPVPGGRRRVGWEMAAPESWGEWAYWDNKFREAK